MTINYNKIFDYLLFLFFFSLCVYLSVFPSSISSVKEGLSVWFVCVLPALFPYMFITAFLSKLKATQKFSSLFSPLTKKLFHQNGIVGYAFILSLISGYPLGAKLVCDLKSLNLISSTDAERAFILCSTSSPAFLIASVGSIMNNSLPFGIKLFVTHFLSAITVGIILSFVNKKPLSNTNPQNMKNADNLFYDSIYGAVISVLTVGGTIVIFSLITDFLDAIKLLNLFSYPFNLAFNDPNISKGFLVGLLECTKGLKMISASNHFLKLPLCAFLSGFGGVSIILQSITYVKKAKIKTASFLYGKILTAFVNFIFGLLFTFIL